jgi:membrane peptidoglycan carboxypeptidase
MLRFWWQLVRQFARVISITLLCLVTVPVGVAAVVIGALIFLPLPATLPTPKLAATSLPSTVFDAQGNQIATFRQFDLNIPVKQSDIPQVLKDAVIASEDKNFYHHGGVDPRGTVRALVADLSGKGYVQGGSTIAQQYVKNAYTGNERTLSRKLREAILASQLVRQVPKDTILFKYLDTIYFGDGAYGVGAASETYFRIPVNQLSISQAALLVGLIPAPSRYEPRANLDLAEERREVVLQKMLDQGYINQAQYNWARVSQIFPAEKVQNLPKGAPVTPVFAPQSDPVKYPYFVDYVRAWLELDPRVGPSMLYHGGLRIQTTIDPTLEAEAENAVNGTLAGTATPVDMSLVSVEPQTGFVKALVGGRDFSVSQTDLALGGCEPLQEEQENQAELAAHKPGIKPLNVVVHGTCEDGTVPRGGGAGRQAGSSFKVFTLAAALSQGISPQQVYNAPVVYTIPGCTGGDAQGCTVHNSGDGEGGFSTTLAGATWDSINTVYAQVITDPRVGVQRVADMAKKLGVTAAWYSPDVHGPSYTLGVVGISPLDMASAYGVIDNHGYRVPPTPVALVEDPHQKILIDDRPTLVHPLGSQVLDPAVADTVTSILKGVISQPGATGTAANINRPAAGKTGTTTNYDDAWFVGYVPTLSTAVWMGKTIGDDSSNPADSLAGTKGHAQVYGGTFSAPTWAAFMSQAVKNVPPTDFTQAAPLPKPAPDQIAPAAQVAHQQRQGLDPGTPSTPSVLGTGGPYSFGSLRAPAAVAPAFTPATTPTPTPTSLPGPSP